jgi:uncharacterized membrane protein YphA (DoxX/SURF4 family)
MKTVLLIARIVMGVIFVVMGLNGFFGFIPLPVKSPEAQEFLEALAKTQYFWPFEKTCEILFGGLLLINRFVVLAIKGLASIIANIILFHLFLDPQGIYLALIVLVCEVILVAGYWKRIFAEHFAWAHEND